MYFAPAVLLVDQTASAAPIVDPRAPVQFRPSVTQTSTGVPVVNIAAPNANGISANSYSSFDVDSNGLVLNNSLVSGTPLLGGTVAANPNLNGRTATTILNQVTSTGPASTLSGPLEVFGAPATVIISNPNGISVNGLSLTNAPGLVLTTGVPQFISGAGGSATSFDNAGALAYQVSSGAITIDGPAGVNGPGSGVEGTVGDIDIIGQSVNVNAPLYASGTLNIIAGNQTVIPMATSTSGTTYQTTNAAAGTSGAVAIDASQYGSVSAGTIFIVSTSAGEGVNLQGPLAATAGNVSVNANGDVVVGQTAATGSVTLTAAGSVSVTDAGVANQGYTVNAAGDINAGGSVSAGQDVVFTAGNDVYAASVAAGGLANLTAGDSMTLGSISANVVSLQAINGNLTINSALTTPGSVSATAGRDITIDGSVTGGSTVTLAGGRNITVSGAVEGVGDTALTAGAGTLSTTGALLTDGALTAYGQEGVSLGGTVFSQGDAVIGSGAGSVAIEGSLTSLGTITINAAQDVATTGTVHSGSDTGINAGGNVALDGGLEVDGTGDATVTAGGDVTGSGAVSVANNAILTAGSSIVLTGSAQVGNDLAAIAAQDVTTGAVTAVGNLAITATGGSVELGGDVLTGGNLSVAAGGAVSASGNVQSLGDLNLDAQGSDLTASGPVSAAGSATLNASQDLALNGTATIQGNATLTATNITTQDVSVGGDLSATAAQRLDTSAGTLDVTDAATLTGSTLMTGNAVVGGAYSATGSQSLTATGTGAYLGDATLMGGTVNTAGTQMAAGALSVTGTTVTNTGALSGLTTASINATALVNSGTIYSPSTEISVSNSTTNSGALMATNALTLATATLNNTGGTIFAGDVNNAESGAGDLTVNVSGPTGSFNNTNGEILGLNSVTLNLPDVKLDPSSATFGTVDGGNAFNLSVAAIANSGTWTLPGTAVSVSASQGISNAGTIDQASGTLVLNGAVANVGAITAQDLTINGSLANATGASVEANDALILNGSGTNAGTVEAVNTLTISGTSYDNSNGTTQVGTSSAGVGDMTINLSGNLTNAGGTITATDDLAIQAASVINTNATAAGATTTTTTTIDNTPLLMATVVGSETVYYPFSPSTDQTSSTQVLTLGDLLSPAGITTGWWAASGALRAGFSSSTAQDESILTNTDYNSVVINSQTTQPVTTSGTVTFQDVEFTAGTDTETGAASIGEMYVVQDGTVPKGQLQDGSSAPTLTVALPTVTETVTTTGAQTVSSVIAAGHDLTIDANSLQNAGGTVSAGNDADLNIQSLVNDAATYTQTITDSVNQASLEAFLSALPYSTAPCLRACSNPQPTLVGVRGSGNAIANQPAIYYSLYKAGDEPTAPSVTSSVTVQGQAGQIVAGHDVNLSGGALTNAGTIAATNDVNITATSFTNQGTNTGTTTTAAGCAAGYSAGCSSLTTSNPNSTTYTYQQINANVTAGNDVVIAANAVNNTYGNIVAGRDVVIGGAGTSASDTSTTPTNLTQAASVTNTSGAIQAGNDVDINAASLVNTIAAPVQIHQNYGSATPYTGCSSNCEAYVDVQSASPATITANHDVNLSATTFANTGSLVTALNNVTISASVSASSDNQYFNAYWHANLTYYDASFPAWGCAGDTSMCATLYGSAYQSAQAQDPAGLPDAVGLPDFVAGTIQAGNTLAVSSPTLTNTGNVIGTSVALTGATLVNGLTNPDVYTPPPAVAGQVITLGPAGAPTGATTTVNAAGLVTNLAGQAVSVTGAAGLPSNSPIGVTTVGTPSAPTVQTVASISDGVTYLQSSPASAVSNDLSPSALLAALPASLQPDTTQFYYDPYTQAQQVEQAALEATGQSSFYALPSTTDATSQTTVNNLDTAALYGAALQYAEQNNVALGTQLSASQLAEVTSPMLWYVEEAVPEPGCTATGNATCPTVQALVPEVLLPQDFATVNADGSITGTDVALNYANSILNTGSITAENLAVSTTSLTNEQRSTNVGDVYAALDDAAGVTKTTGTVVQQGGLMAAANYQLNVDTLNQIGGSLQQVNADGSENDAATAQLLANLKSQLGSSFTQSKVSDDLQTTVVADNSESIWGKLFTMVVIAVISMGAASAASAAIGAASTAAGAGAAGSGSTFAAAGVANGAAVSAGVGNAALSAAVGGMVDSAMTQTAFGSGFSFGAMFEAGATAFVTAGLTNGITYSTQAGLGFTTSASTSSLAALAGVQSVGNALVPTASSATGSGVTAALALAADAGIQASAQSLIEGGSFLTNLRNDAAADVAASANYAIGNLFGPTGTDPDMLASVLSHAALGCAAGAASGEGCGGGAIGGAASAALSPAFVSAMDPSGADINDAQRAILTAFATATAGSAAILTGTNLQGAVSQATSEALNNTAAPGHILDEIGGKPGTQNEGEKFTLNVTPRITADEEEELQEGGSGTDAEAVTVGQGTAVGAAAGASTSTAAGGDDVWGLMPTVRGVTIESQLALSEYSPANGWYQVGAENNGYFPLVDFQNGNTLVSLKSIDTTGTTWLPRMENVIDQLGSSGATVNGVPANMVLDVRVQPGGSAAAQSLVSYGASRGVTVTIKVYP